MQKIVNVKSWITQVDKDRIEYPANMSSLAKDFIQNLVKKNPNERMKSYRLLNHPFLDREKKKEGWRLVHLWCFIYVKHPIY